MSMQNKNPEQNKEIIDSCPHCGHKLSPWQQVLLSVDRVLTCKNCWYRIILDVFEEDKNTEDKKENNSKS